MVVHVRRGVTWAESTTRPRFGPPKTDAGLRAVAVPPNIVADVKHHLATHTQWGKDGLLFANPTTGEPIPQGQHYKAWNRARNVAGRPDLRFHDLRHTGLTLAAQAGATIGELMLRAGHTTPTAAMRYQQASAERDQAIAERMAKMAGSR
jgi:integrase